VIRDTYGQHALLLKRPKPFENDCDSHHRAADDRPHEPTAGLDDFEHEEPEAPLKGAANYNALKPDSP
jgi:hypothetical protein